MADRKQQLSWEEFEMILKKLDRLAPEEEIREITLVKPKQILIHTRR